MGRTASKRASSARTPEKGTDRALNTALNRAIDRYSPEVAATARAALAKLRRRFPGAQLHVYERPGSLPIGLVPSDGRAAPFSVVLYPRWVRFFFLWGVALDDPEHRLEGTGKVVRSIRLDPDAAMLDDPYIRNLMQQALAESAVDLATGDSKIVFKSKRQS